MSGTLCTRWGPGRLPYADHRGIGAGIAIGGMGVLVSLLWFGVAWILLATGLANTTLGFVFLMGLLVLPLAAPFTVLAAIIAWQKLYPSTKQQVYGALFGLAAGIVGLFAGSFGPSLVLFLSNVHRGEMAVFEAMGFFLLVPIAFVAALFAAGWFVLPLLAFAGWYHERAKGQ